MADPAARIQRDVRPQHPTGWVARDQPRVRCPISRKDALKHNIIFRIHGKVPLDQKCHGGLSKKDSLESRRITERGPLRGGGFAIHWPLRYQS